MSLANPETKIRILILFAVAAGLLCSMPVLAVEHCDKEIESGKPVQNCVQHSESIKQKTRLIQVEIDAGLLLNEQEFQKELKISELEDKRLLDEIIK